MKSLTLDVGDEPVLQKGDDSRVDTTFYGIGNIREKLMVDSLVLNFMLVVMSREAILLRLEVQHNEVNKGLQFASRFTTLNRIVKLQTGRAITHL